MTDLLAALGSGGMAGEPHVMCVGVPCAVEWGGQGMARGVGGMPHLMWVGV